jgi:hypothetical protein
MQAPPEHVDANLDANFEIFWTFYDAHLFSPLLTMYESRWKCKHMRQSI